MIITKYCALFLLLGIVVFVPPNHTLAHAIDDQDNDKDGDNGRPIITTVFDYVITVDQDNGVNDSTCYPTSPGIPSNISCSDINFALRFPKTTHSTKFVLVPGKVPHFLKNNSFIRNTFNVAFIGNGSVHSIVKCAPGAGLSFVNSTNVILENIHFRFCGALHNSTSMDFTESLQKTQLSLVSLYFYNCSNVTMYNVAVNESRNAMGVVMYDTVGYNQISRCTFYNNTVNDTTSRYAGGGGFAVEFTFCPPGDLQCNTTTYSHHKRYRRNHNAHYVFYKCVFQENIAYPQTLVGDQKMDKFVVLHHNETHELFGRGAGIVIYFKGEAMKNRIEIQKCVFSNNKAVWGGAIAIAYKDNTIDNIVSIEGSQFLRNKCFRTLDYETGGGGIVIASSLQNLLWNLTNNYTNHVSIKNSEFSNNFCVHGGGIYYFLALQLDIATVTLNVSNCNFTFNSGRLGSAVKVSPYLMYTGNAPSIIFSDCTFERNFEVDFISGSTYYKVGLGTVYIFSVPVTFLSQIKFLNNTSSALGVANTDIDCSSATMTFIGNTGTDGGGIALVGAASVLIGTNTSMIFKENHVSRFGGAIFSQYIGRELMKASVKCFVHYNNPFVHPKDWNSSFIFQGNTAKKLGNSIFATSIFPCSWNDDNVSSVFCTNDRWMFKNQNGALANCSNEIFTEAYTFTVSKTSAFPGKGFSLSVTAMDDLKHDVTYDTVYNAYIIDPEHSNTAQVDPRFADITANYIVLTGEGNQNVSLELETANSRLDHVRVPIELMQCPPGLIRNYTRDQHSDSDRLLVTCKCRGEYTFVNNMRCFRDTYSARVIGYNWIGMLDGDNDTLYMSAFPREFHHLFQHTGHKSGMLSLPNKYDELDSTICGPSNRTGILCGNCTEGYATAVNSLKFECILCRGNETNFALNIFAYLSLSFIPYTILFGVIVFFNIRLTSSAANSFILFAQLLSAGMFPIDGNKLAYLDIGKHLSVTQSVYTIVYGVFNLNSFSLLMHPFCISKKFTTLDVLCLDYAMAAFPLVVIIFIQFLIYLKSRSRCCVMWKKHSIRQPAPQIESNKSPKRSLLHAFVAFIFLSYTKFSLASMRILNSTRLFNENGTYYGPRRIYYAGHYTFADKEFIFPYGFLTLFILVFFVLLPPLLLLGPFRFIDWLLDKPKFAIFRKYWPSIAIHSYMDAAFHGYKLNRRIFAGIYLLFRLSIFLNFSFNTNQTMWLLIQQVLCSIMMLLVAVFQPHQRAFFNFVDAFILLSLVILNSLSVYISVVQLESAYEFFPVGVYIFEYIIVWLPLVYMITYLIWEFVLKNTKCGIVIKDKLNVYFNSETADSEVLRPLIRPDRGTSIDETHVTLADEEMFKRAEIQNLYRPATPDTGSESSVHPLGTTATITDRSESSVHPLGTTATSAESATNRSNTSTY